MAKFLDSTGLTTLWNTIKARFTKVESAVSDMADADPIGSVKYTTSSHTLSIVGKTPNGGNGKANEITLPTATTTVAGLMLPAQVNVLNGANTRSTNNAAAIETLKAYDPKITGAMNGTMASTYEGNSSWASGDYYMQTLKGTFLNATEVTTQAILDNHTKQSCSLDVSYLTANPGTDATGNPQTTTVSMNLPIACTWHSGLMGYRHLCLLLDTADATLTLNTHEASVKELLYRLFTLNKASLDLPTFASVESTSVMVSANTAPALTTTGATATIVWNSAMKKFLCKQTVNSTVTYYSKWTTTSGVSHAYTLFSNSDGSARTDMIFKRGTSTYVKIINGTMTTIKADNILG